MYSVVKYKKKDSENNHGRHFSCFQLDFIPLRRCLLLLSRLISPVCPKLQHYIIYHEGSLKMTRHYSDSVLCHKQVSFCLSKKKKKKKKGSPLWVLNTYAGPQHRFCTHKEYLVSWTPPKKKKKNLIFQAHPKKSRKKWLKK